MLLVCWVCVGWVVWLGLWCWVGCLGRFCVVLVFWLCFWCVFYLLFCWMLVFCFGWLGWLLVDCVGCCYWVVVVCWVVDWSWWSCRELVVCFDGLVGRMSVGCWCLVYFSRLCWWCSLCGVCLVLCFCYCFLWWVVVGRWGNVWDIVCMVVWWLFWCWGNWCFRFWLVLLVLVGCVLVGCCGNVCLLYGSWWVGCWSCLGWLLVLLIGWLLNLLSSDCWFSFRSWICWWCWCWI